MSYTIEVTMQDREGAVTRLVMLLSQRHIDIAQFSAKRSGVGTINAVIEVEGSRERAPWALRQVGRNHNVLSAKIRNSDPASAELRAKSSGSRRCYPVYGRSLNRQRTVVVRRDSRVASAKS
jgi:hypothetical protein